MKVIQPVIFQSTQLLSTTAVETYSNYAAGTTYNTGDKVIYNYRVFESLVSSNTGNQPDTNPTKWLDIAPANKYACFDNTIGTQTTGTSPLVIEVQPGKICNSLALLNITNGTSLDIEVKDGVGGTVVYSKTIDLDASIILDWYMYFFEPFDLRDTVVLTDIPPYSNCVIKITLSGTGTISVGNFIYGTSTEIGATQYGVTFGIRDYSVKDTDDFGNTIFVKRAFNRRMEPQLMLDNTKLRYVSKLLSELRATPTVWVGSEDAQYEPLVIFGFYKDYTIDIQYPSASLIRVDIEGLS